MIGRTFLSCLYPKFLPIRIKSSPYRRWYTENNMVNSEVYHLKDYKSAHFSGREHFEELYKESIEKPDLFWSKMAVQHIDWFNGFKQVTSGTLEQGNVAWFLNGTLNASYNCIDRHIPLHAKKTAIIWEADDPLVSRHVTYEELLHDVSQVANALKELGIKKGDRVSIYMPMVPEAAIAMLACARIGAIHTSVFAGFSSHSLSNRINNSKSKLVITANEGMRGGKVVPLKQITDEALKHCSTVEKVLVFKRTNATPEWNPNRDIWWDEIVKKQKSYCPPEPMNSEDTLFLLYTSGSTGQPKGMEHTTGGYLLYTSMTHKYLFDYRPGDIYACVADIGWITGHSYIVYGPLTNGATTLMFESTPTYPNPSRYWDMIQKHQITQFYTAPTALRALMGFGTQPFGGYDLSSLRVIGTVGEPINPAAWRWYFENVGKGRCPVVDTYWQTETGGIVISPVPGVTSFKPGAASIPFFGIKPEVMDEKGNPQKGNHVTGLLTFQSSWPGMARTVHGDHPRFLNTYLRAYPGYYFTGDGCYRDHDGYYWITGRVDDVINKAGHRLGSAEVESALVTHSSCSEAAVVTIPDEVMGEKIIAYCTLAEGHEESGELIAELKKTVAKEIGKFAIPDRIILISMLPKTRSGKIMRRILRKIILGQTTPEELGDTSTLADPEVLHLLIEKVKKING